MFLIIIDLESPENCTAMFFPRLSEKPRTSSQKLVLQKMRNTPKFPQAHDRI